MRVWILVSIISSSLLSLVVCLYNSRDFTAGYEIVCLLPLSFIILYFTIYSAILKRKSMHIIAYAVIALSWIRCVFIPMFGSISGLYMNISGMATIHSTKLAILSIAYEQIIVGVLLFVYSCKKQKKMNTIKKEIKLEGDNGVYVIYIFFALVIFLIIGRNLNLFKFILISTEESSRIGDITDTTLIFIRQIISCGMTFMFLLVTEKCLKAYNRTKRHMYINYALIGALLLVGIIVGERRSSQIYLAFASAWLLVRVFPLKRKKIIYTISLAALLIILMMSIYKFFNAFLYGSYLSAVTNADKNLGWFVQTLDSYFYGIRVVSSNIGFSNFSQLSIVNMIYDFSRSTFGLSFLLKGSKLTTSEIYNLTIYSGAQKTGYLFSSIGYGYIYLGGILAPIITCLNVYIALKLEEWLRRCKSIEANYIVSYIFMRFAFGLFGNPAPLISTGSAFLICNGIIFIGALMWRDIRRKVGSIEGSTYLKLNGR